MLAHLVFWRDVLIEVARRQIMKTGFVVLLILSVVGAYAYIASADDITIYPPQFPGDTSTIRTPGGDYTYQPPVGPGDSGSIDGPGGSRWTVDPPLYPGDVTRIRK